MIRIVMLLTLSLVALPGFAQTLNISNAWIRDLPPSISMRAGYLSLENKTEHLINISSITSESFNRIEIHKTITKDGMMSMKRLDSLQIKPGKSVHLAPGGLHFMMIKPHTPVKLGDQISLTLTFDNGDSQSTLMLVKK